MAAEGARSATDKLIAVAAIVTLTAAAGVIGTLAGQYLVDLGVKRAAQGEVASPLVIEPLYDGPSKMVRLPPIIANLASPEDTWIRVEASIVLDAGVTDPNALASQVGEDALAYLRTLRLAELQGPSGLLHLKEDLNERASIRGEEAVRELILESMVVQ